VGQDSPSLEEVEDKIQARMAQASAKAELDASTGEGALAELKRSTMELEASATLDSLRAELGLGSPPELPASEPAPSPETPPSA
jgi:phage shock protein A